MPKHILFLLRHAGVGALISTAFVGMVFWFDLGGIGHLVTHTAEGPLALAVFWVLCTITFGSAQMGIRVMLLAATREDDH